MLYNGTPILPQTFAPSHGGIWTPSNTWFPGPTQVLKPNGSSIVFARLTNVTDRPSDHATRSVRIGRIYVRSTAMRPNNFSETPPMGGVSCAGACWRHGARKFQTFVCRRRQRLLRGNYSTRMQRLAATLPHEY